MHIRLATIPIYTFDRDSDKNGQEAKPVNNALVLNDLAFIVNNSVHMAG